MSPKRPLLRWHGGKWMLAPWILQHMPKHRIYVEPFAGAASVLLRKPRAHAEVLNDLDGDLVNFFRVLRDATAASRLIAELELTPFAREEFRDSYGPSDDPVERARRFAVKAFMSHGTTSRRKNSTGFRHKSYRQNATGPQDWRNYPASLPIAIDRLRGVLIENRPALDLIWAQDTPDTLFYCDPPYMPATRSAIRFPSRADRAYAYEMDEPDHVALLQCLVLQKGMVMLSGYPSELYDSALVDWRRVETIALADGARERTEVLWLNPACAAALDSRHLPLFHGEEESHVV